MGSQRVERTKHPVDQEEGAPGKELPAAASSRVSFTHRVSDRNERKMDKAMIQLRSIFRLRGAPPDVMLVC